MAQAKLSNPPGISGVQLCLLYERGAINDLCGTFPCLLTVNRLGNDVWACSDIMSPAVVRVIFPVPPPICGSDGQRLSLAIGGLYQKTGRPSPVLLRNSARSQLTPLRSLRFLFLESDISSICCELGGVGEGKGGSHVMV